MALIDYKYMSLDMVIAFNKCGFCCECDADSQGVNLRYEEI